MQTLRALPAFGCGLLADAAGIRYEAGGKLPQVAQQATTAA